LDTVGVLVADQRQQPDREHDDCGCGHQHPTPTPEPLAGKIILRRRVRLAPIEGGVLTVKKRKA
jgi:hypothetical protein